MSGALDRLVRRVRGTLPTVEPVLPSRWAPRAGDAGFRETHTEVVAREPEPVVRAVPPGFSPETPLPRTGEARRPADRVAQGRPTVAEPHADMGGERASSDARPGLAPGPQPQPTSISTAAASPAGANPDPLFRPVVPEPALAQPATEDPPTRHAVSLGAALPQHRTDGAAAAPAAQQPQSPNDSGLAQRRPETAPPLQPAPTVAEPARSEPAAARQADARRNAGPPQVETQLPKLSPTEPVAQRQVRPQMHSPDVHVTIGRVEVHPPPRAPDPVRTPAVTRPRISLEDYQRQRRERGR